MIRLIMLNTFFFFLSVHVFCQFDICDSLVIRGHQTLFDTKKIYTTSDYVNKFYPEQSRYLSNRNELESLSLWLNLDSIMLFKDGSDEIKISFSNKNIDPTDIFYPKPEGQTFSKIREYAEGYPFGITSEDTVSSNIAEISINDIKLPVSSFSDLLNPNRYETILSVKPIEVYRSKCGQYFFIYIFGKPNTDIMMISEAIDFSYMAKIVVSKKGYYVDRIVIPGEKLKYFGYGECPYFVGF